MGKLIELLKPKHMPIAIYHAKEKPDYAVDPEKGGCFIPLLLLPAMEGKTVAAKKEQIGCKGAWDGLGLGGEEPEMRAKMAEYYSTGADGREGRYFFCCPEIARDNYLSKIPVYDMGEYVVFQPMVEVERMGIEPEVVVMPVDGVEYSAMVILASFSRNTEDSVVRSAFGFGCEQMYAMSVQEGEREAPRMVLGPTELFTRRFLDPGMMTLSMPYKLYKRLEEDCPYSFLKDDSWRETTRPKQKCCDC